MKKLTLVIFAVTLIAINGCAKQNDKKIAEKPVYRPISSLDVSQLKVDRFTASIGKVNPFIVAREIKSVSDAPPESWSKGKEAPDNLRETDRYFYFYNEGNVNRIEKTTGVGTSFSIASFLKKLAGKNTDEERLGRFHPVLIPLSDRYLILHAYSNGGGAIEPDFSLLHDFKENRTIEANNNPLPCAIYCGVNFYKGLSDHEFLLKYSGGDACWSGGHIEYFSAKENKGKNILSFADGCGESKYGLIGATKKDIYFSNRIQNSKNLSKTIDSSPYFIPTSIEKKNIYTDEVVTVIDEKTMPRNTLEAYWLNDQIILETPDSTFAYDIVVGSIQKIKLEKNNGPEDWPSEDRERFIEDLKIDKKIITIDKLLQFNGDKDYSLREKYIYDDDYPSTTIGYLRYDQLIDREGNPMNALVEEKLMDIEKVVHQAIHCEMPIKPVSFRNWRNFMYRSLSETELIIATIKVCEVDYIGIYDLNTGLIYFYDNTDQFRLTSVDADSQSVLLMKPFSNTGNAYRVLDLSDGMRLAQSFVLDASESITNPEYGPNLQSKLLEAMGIKAYTSIEHRSTTGPMAIDDFTCKVEKIRKCRYLWSADDNEYFLFIDDKGNVSK